MGRDALSLAIRRARGAFWAVGGFSLVINMLLLVAPLYTLQVFDRVLSSQSHDTLLLLTVAAVFLLVIQGLLEVVRGTLLQRIGLRLEQDLGSAVVGAAIDEAARGNTHSTHGINDLKEVRTALTSPSINALFDAPWTPIFVGVIFLMHPLAGMFAMAGAVGLALLAFLNIRAARRPEDEAARQVLDGGRNLIDYVRNAEAVRAMGMSGGLIRKWQRENTEILWLQSVVGGRVGLVMAITKTFRMLLQVGIMGLGVWLVLQNEMTPGAMIASSIILARALAPMEQAVTAWKGWVSAMGAYGRLKEALDVLEGDARDREGQITLPQPKGQVDLVNVSYRPPSAGGGPSEPIVANVSFSIPAGASLGIVGPSGSGKTTLLRILAGLAPPTLGEARLDGADLTRWCSIPAEQGGLGAYLGYLPQSIQLVAGTVGENIARFGDTPSSEAVIAAAQMADVHDMILRLPQGYDTLVGDGGLALSGGQQQRVGLARALYGTPRLVLLDEPNAHLDPEGERALVKSLDALAHQGTTVVMVTHRAALLAHVQLVAVMRDRTVLEFGPRDSVMAKLREAAGMAAAGAAGAGATGAGAGAQSGRVARSSPNAMEAVR